jgi:hypothetical protein
MTSQKSGLTLKIIVASAVGGLLFLFLFLYLTGLIGFVPLAWDITKKELRVDTDKFRIEAEKYLEEKYSEDFVIDHVEYTNAAVDDYLIRAHTTAERNIGLNVVGRLNEQTKEPYFRDDYSFKKSLIPYSDEIFNPDEYTTEFNFNHPSFLFTLTFKGIYPKHIDDVRDFPTFVALDSNIITSIEISQVEIEQKIRELSSLLLVKDVEAITFYVSRYEPHEINILDESKSLGAKSFEEAYKAHLKQKCKYSVEKDLALEIKAQCTVF